MFEKDEKELSKEVAELDSAFASSKKELAESRAMLRELNVELEQNTARLTSARREVLVAEKKVKDAQNAILVFKGKLARMDAGVNLLEKESQSAETRLKELSAEKQNLVDSIAKVESDMAETRDGIDGIDSKTQELLSQVRTLETEKAKLSEEISKFLTGSSLEKEASEAKLNDLAMHLADRIRDRNNAKDLLAESKEPFSKLQSEIKELDEKRLMLEELRDMEAKRASLASDIDKMKNDALLRRQRKEDLQKTLSDKEEELNMLSSTNAEARDSIALFEERVGRYEELSQRTADAEKKLAESGVLIDKAISDVKRLFNDNNDLRQRL